MVVEAQAGGPQTRAEREAEGLLQLTRARIEAREIDERERENTSAIVLLGRRLCTIQKQGYHKLEQERARFADWVDKNMPFQIRQARRYMAVAHLAPELVAGRTLSLTKLQIIAAAPAWARELLCQKCDSSTDAARMRRAVKAGLEHARRYECIPEAVLHIAAVLDGEPALRAEKRLDDPEALGDEAISLLQRLLTSLQKLAKLGLPLTGKWVQQLVHIEGLTHAELELLMGSLRQQKPRSESEILEAAAAASETAAAREAARSAAQRAGVAEVIDDLSAAMARPVSRATAAPAPVSRATAAPTPPVSRVTAAPTAEAAPSSVAAPPAPVSRATTAPTAEAAPTPGAEPTAAAAPPAEASPAEESPAEESPAEASPAEESPAEESPAEESPAPAAAPASVEWADLCAAIRGVLSRSEQFELTLGLVAQVCECNAASRERGQRAIRRLNDFAEEVEGPGKLPAGTINSLVRQLLAESLHARFWLATQLLGESRLPSALLYLHSIRGMVPLAYRLHLEDMCKLYPMRPPVSDQDPEAYDAWVAKLHQDALDAKALVIARRKAEEAARRKAQGW